VTPPSSADPRHGYLSDTIVAMGLASSEAVDAAIAQSRVQGKLPEAILVEQGLLDDDGLARARAERAGLNHVDLEVFERDRDADALIGNAAARRYHALPIAVEGRALVVALADPFDAPAIAEIAALAKREVIPVVAGAAAIDARIDELPERTSDEEQLPEPPRLQPIEGGGGRRSTDSPRGGLPEILAERILEKIDTTLDEVARSEILRALDDATTEIERLSAELDQSELRAKALESERDELRAALGSDPGPQPS
jgi:hypothetical protein